MSPTRYSDSIADGTVAQIDNAGYSASSACNPYTDVVDVTTEAPSSVTSPLVSTYGNKINIVAGDPQASSLATGGTSVSEKKHAPEKHALKKHVKGKKPTVKKRAQKKHAPAKRFKNATPAPGKVHEVRFHLPRKK
ncbi:hypothetical protein [Streptomyces sp. YKOK-I1]